MTLTVNFFASPGSGKSTMAAALFAMLKDQFYVNCELCGEYAKDMVWEGRTEIFKNQFYIAAKQYHREQRLLDKVDVIISDSPLILSLFYTPEHYPASYKDFILQTSAQSNSINFLIKRVKPFNPKGRNHSEKQAAGIQEEIIEFLDEQGIEYIPVDGTIAQLDKILIPVLKRLDSDKPYNYPSNFQAIRDMLTRLETE